VQKLLIKFEFDKELHSDKPVVPNFTESWCQSCQAAAPFFNEHAEAVNGYSVSINMDEKDYSEAA
jgi:thiol-disulfide isomerase/thioredoxin